MHASSRPADEKFQRSTFQKTDTILSCIVHAHVKGMFPTKQYYCSHYKIFAEMGD